MQAVDYYLAVTAANPSANITFTGHSLGGGIAALMGVFFGKVAVRDGYDSNECLIVVL